MPADDRTPSNRLEMARQSRLLLAVVPTARMFVTFTAAARWMTSATSKASCSAARFACVSKRSGTTGPLLLVEFCLQFLQVFQMPLRFAHGFAGGGLSVGGHVEHLG